VFLVNPNPARSFLARVNGSFTLAGFCCTAPVIPRGVVTSSTSSEGETRRRNASTCAPQKVDLPCRWKGSSAPLSLSCFFIIVTYLLIKSWREFQDYFYALRSDKINVRSSVLRPANYVYLLQARSNFRNMQIFKHSLFLLVKLATILIIALLILNYFNY